MTVASPGRRWAPTIMSINLTAVRIRAGRALTSVVAAVMTLAGFNAVGSTRPNILFAVADDWSYGHAGAYGCRWVQTPAFDRLARQGILFTHAYTPSAKCAPSRSSILTGRNPWQLKAAANHICYFPPEFKTWAEALAEHGYYVGMTGKGWGPGVATNASGQLRQMAGKPFNQHTTAPPTSGIANNDYAASKLSTLTITSGGC